MQVLKKGDVIEGHRVILELGRGAASIIYLVQDVKSKQIWALKHVHRESPKDQRFIDQAEAEQKVAAALDHPAIRKIPRCIKKRKLLTTQDIFLVMEHVDGESMDRSPPRTFEQAVSVFLQVAEGLSHMHDRGYVHADMKPNNIVVDADGTAKVIDLGQSCPTGTVKERIQGTPDYIAPEQVHRREIMPKTDIYNLGATMYWILTRQHIPTAMPKGDTLMNSVDDALIEKATPPIEVNKRIPEKLNDLILRCVEVDQEKRPASMREVSDCLSLILGILRAQSSSGRTKAGMTKQGGSDPDDSTMGSPAPVSG